MSNQADISYQILPGHIHMRRWESFISYRGMGAISWLMPVEYITYDGSMNNMHPMNILCECHHINKNIVSDTYFKWFKWGTAPVLGAPFHLPEMWNHKCNSTLSQNPRSFNTHPDWLLAVVSSYQRFIWKYVFTNMELINVLWSHSCPWERRILTNTIFMFFDPN